MAEPNTLKITADKAFAFIVSFYGEYGTTPTLQEIADHFSIARERTYTRQWAKWVVGELVRTKRVELVEGKQRNIKLI